VTQYSSLLPFAAKLTTTGVCGACLNRKGLEIKLKAPDQAADAAVYQQ
jgi:hypothetical protein